MRPLQQQFYSLSLTDRFTHPWQSDPLFSPCHPTYSLAGPMVSYIGIPFRPFQADFTIFTDASTQGWGAHMGDSQISGVWTHSESKLHINVLELKAVILALQHWVTVLQGHYDIVATDKNTVVGGTHSHPLLWLVVDLFLWLQTQDINSSGQSHLGLAQCNSRPVISVEPANHNRVESPPRCRESNI